MTFFFKVEFENGDIGKKNHKGTLLILLQKLTFFFNSDDHPNDTMEYALISREKTKKGPPINKHISVRNIKAQIANMSSNECSGFKSEYHVRTNNKI